MNELYFPPGLTGGIVHNSARWVCGELISLPLVDPLQIEPETMITAHGIA